MKRITATLRMTIGLVALAFSVLMTAMAMGLVPDRRAAEMEGRAALCETIAVTSSVAIAQGNLRQLQINLEGVVARNQDLLSAGVRRADGRLVAVVGEHVTNWHTPSSGKSTETEFMVPILRGNRPWGMVELRFSRITAKGPRGWLESPLVKLSGFSTLVSFLFYFLYLRRMLQHLDPARVVPARVRAAFNTLAEGLLVLDRDERIVLANDAFAKTLGRSASELVGCKASELMWTGEDDKDPREYPWLQSIRDREQQRDVTLSLRLDEQESRIFKISTTPIVGDKGDCRGALASFSDVTAIERSRSELRRMLEALRTSREEISRQNQVLQVLATRDPLTSCLNRRSFFEQFEAQWKQAEVLRQPLSVIMVDVDHFKFINDSQGHATGDTVLQRLANVLRAWTRETDYVCRYGGEEFAILLPTTDLEGAVGLAESLRTKIAEIKLGELKVTASLGVAERTSQTGDPHALLNHADQCLYVAKRLGRNRVVRADQLTPEVLLDAGAGAKPAPAEGTLAHFIPFHAVTALLSALAYRDNGTAEHSRRVADLCVATAEGLLPSVEVYILEVAALMHDIGKIGVPDAILLKPGPLTENEWKIMGQHDRYGVEILHSTFSCPRLTEIVLNHHAWFGGHPRHPELPTGAEIPLGARILTIADAYDAIVSNRVYRRGRTQEEAFAELQRCAGRQFDPQLVERFISVIANRSDCRTLSIGPVSKQAALQIGLEIERLASSLDAQDIFSLKSLASRLRATALKNGVTQIANVTAQIEEAADSDPDMKQLFQLTSELLELCRSTQRAYLDADRGEPEPSEPAQLAGV